MPNYCCFEGKIKGKLANIVEFSKYAAADYRSDEDGNREIYYMTSAGKKVMIPKHLGWRVFEFVVNFPEIIEGHEQEDVCLDFDGYCAWSVYSCMFPGPHSYITDNHALDEAFTLPELCRETCVALELFSTEPGCGFAEHYLVDGDGDVIEDDCVDYVEYYIGDTENYSDFLKEYETTNITQEAFEKAKQNDSERLIVCQLFNGTWPYKLDSDDI